MQKNDRPPVPVTTVGTSTVTPPAVRPAKKKLTLDVTDVSEVLERKISP
jgi:hypothetical protein